MARNTDATTWCETLYAAKAAELLLYGRALGLSHSESEDVLHETFVALLAREEAPAQPAFFAVRAFRNRALNYRRGFWRRLARELESSRWFERHSPASADEEAAMVALSQLPADQREVIVLKIWHRHTFAEIGALLGLSPHTAAGRYRYGLQKIRTHLQDIAYEPEEGFPNGWDAAKPARNSERRTPDPADGLMEAEATFARP